MLRSFRHVAVAAVILAQPALAPLALAQPAPGQATPAPIAERSPPRPNLATDTVPGWASMCRANGAYIREGKQACIRTSYGRRIAMCGKVDNVLNWEVSATSCPEP